MHWRTATAIRDVLIVASGLTMLPAGWSQEPAPKPPASAEQHARLKERDELAKQAKALRQAGKLDEAVGVLEKVVVIEHAVFGEVHEDVAGSLQQIAELHEQIELPKDKPDFSAARKARQEVLEIKQKLFGPATHHPTRATLNNQWQVTDARLAFEKLDLMSRLSVAAARELSRADQLDPQIENLHSKGRFADAVKFTDQQLAIRRKILGEAHPNYATSLNNLAEQCRAKGEYARAEPLYRQVLEIRRKVLGESHPGYAGSLSDLADLYRSLGQFARSEQLHRQALEIRKMSLGEANPDYATSLNNLAEQYYLMGDFVHAERLSRQAHEIRKKALGESHPDCATNMYVLGMIYHAQADNAQAEPLFRRALEIRKNALGEDHPHYATSLDSLAGVYRSMGDYTRAEPLYLQALEIRKRVLGEVHPHYAISLSNLGTLYFSMRDFARAEPLFRQGLESEKRSLGEMHPRYATTLNNLGSLYAMMNDYARAEPLYLQALDIRKNVLGETHPHYAAGLTNLAGLYYVMGDYVRSESIYRHAMDVMKKSLGEGHPSYALCHSGLGGLYSLMGDDRRAEPIYRQALAITRAHMELTAAVQSEYQQLTMAASQRYLLDSYLSIAERIRVTAGAFVSDDGLSEPRNNNRDYQELFSWKGGTLLRQWAMRRAAAEPELAALLSDLERTSARLAALYRPMRQLKEVENWSRQVVELSERRERIEVQLAGRSAAFRAALSPGRLNDLQYLLPANVALVDFLEYTRSEPDPNKKGRWSKERRLLAFVIKPETFQQNRKTRKPTAIRVELGPAEPIWRAIDDWRSDILHQPIVGESTSSARLKPSDSSLSLRTLVWVPIEKFLEAVHTVLIAPDGVLGRLPFAALPGRKAGTYLLEDYALTIVPAPQMMLVQWMAGQDGIATGDLHEQSSYSPRMLVVGGVDYDAEPGGKNARQLPEPLLAVRGVALVARPEATAGASAVIARFGPLAGAKSEVAAIEQLFRTVFAKGTAQTLAGSEASESRVRQAAGKYRFVHFATHGFFAPREFSSGLAASSAVKQSASGLSQAGAGLPAGLLEPATRFDPKQRHPGLLSGLVFAGANRTPQPGEDDGILTAAEVADMNLDSVELAALSACETGLGEVAGGEGILGLQRAFQVAGARTTITSLWKVDDAATQALMVEFYKNLWQKKLGKLEALRQAQLTMLRHYDPKAGKLRGLALEPADSAASNLKPEASSLKSQASTPLPPFYWAAFVLSGDWR